MFSLLKNYVFVAAKSLKSLELPYANEFKNLDPLWCDLSQATTSHKRPPRLGILAGRLQ